MRRTILIAGLAAAALAAPGTAMAATVKAADGRFGRYLTDGRGLTLYVFAEDPRGRSVCYGRCARAWPPLYARSGVRAGTGARGRLLGTTRRRDGRRQVTYRGRPLYYYVNETRPGQIFCQGVRLNGGLWWLVRPDGRVNRRT